MRGMVAAIALLASFGAQAETRELALSGTGPWNVTPYLDYAPELTPGVPPDDSQYVPLDQESATFGLLSGTYWFRARVRNNLDHSRLALEVENPRLGLVEFWSARKNGLVRVARVGDTEPPTLHVLSRRPAAFEMRVKPGDAETLLVRITHHGSLQLRVWVWPETQYLWHASLDDIWVGALAGAIAIMFFYNALMVVLVRRWSYFYFTAFILFYFLYILALKGLGNDFVWVGNRWIAVRGVICFSGAASFFMHAFSRSFLGTARRAPRLDKVILAGMVTSLVVAFGSISYSLVISYLAHALVAIAPMYILAAALVCWRAGYRPSGVFFLAWSVLLVCAGMLSLVSLGWLPKYWHAESVVHFGFALSLALFSLALDARARISAVRFRAHLERQVDERTAELQAALANVRTLSGMIPICSHCKKIRDDAGYWNQVETFLHAHGDVNLTHGVCPDCAEKYYPSARNQT